MCGTAVIIAHCVGWVLLTYDVSSYCFSDKGGERSGSKNHLVKGPASSNILPSGDNLLNYSYCTYQYVLWQLVENFILRTVFLRWAVVFNLQFLNLNEIIINAR
jgi:hypothetical protein